MTPRALVFGFLAAFAAVGSVSSSKFDEVFQPIWGSDHFTYDGELVKMKLDNYSGKKMRERKSCVCVCLKI